ncbi:hypothetical protein, partial [Methanocalculus sp. MSAO_Arc1]|uniref:hypothetical protein n=1 Tax=Methanocalculus sp. MSAO_Arc1 TaxID=2293854 RepID=UPI0025F7F940
MLFPEEKKSVLCIIHNSYRKNSGFFQKILSHIQKRRFIIHEEKAENRVPGWRHIYVIGLKDNNFSDEVYMRERERER